jgi:hypothetical protein
MDIDYEKNDSQEATNSFNHYRRHPDFGADVVVERAQC